jgi:hypothetical protein
MSFSIGAMYRDNEWCDVINMNTCHLLLGKLWQYDTAAIHDETKNMYSVMVGKIKLTLLTSQEAEPKPSQGDSQPFVAKRKLMSMGSSVKGVVPEPVKEVLEEFVDVFLAKLPKEMPQLQGIQPQLDLVPGSNLSIHPHYNKGSKEHNELRRQVEEIHLSESIVFFMKKRNHWER